MGARDQQQVMSNRPRQRLLKRFGAWRVLGAVLLGLLVVVMQNHSWAASKQPWRVGTDPTFPPFEYRDAQSNQISGFDIELMQAIGEQAGHPIEWVPLPFDGLIPALQARSVDAAISAMTITAQRARAIDFSRPYFKAGQAIVVRDGEPNFQSLAALKGRRIAVQIGTTGALAASKVPDARVTSFDSTPPCPAGAR
jgi:arginine/lysine/histidine/glutamine transport system substrate-binding/permease protein